MPVDIGLIGNEFFSNVVLPFILVFTVLFSILDKTEILGKKKDIQAIVSLVISLLFIGVPSAITVLQKFIPLIAVILIILFAWLLVFGFAGTKVQTSWTEGLKKVFLIVIGLTVLAAITWSVGSTMGWFSNIAWGNILSAQVTQMLIFIGAIIAVVAIAVSTGEGEKEK